MAAKKNICIAINSLGGGGTEKQCLLLARSLQSGHNVVVVVTKPLPIFPRYKAEILKNDISINVLKGNYVKRMFDFTKFLKRNGIEIIFSYLPSDITMASICGRLAGVPYVIGGIRNDRMPKMKAWVLRFLHNRVVNFSISNSFSAYEFFYKKGFNKDKISVVPNGIVIKELPITRSDKPEIVITSLGRFVRQKDYKTALKSVAYLKEELGLENKIKYQIVGHGPEMQVIEDLIIHFNLRNEVSLVVSPDDPLELLRQSDIYLCSSIHEGISNSVMEAMSCSLPVIATDVGDNKRLVKHGESGWIVEAKDHVSIAQHLQQLVKSQSTRNQMGLNGYEHLKSRYGADQFKEQYLKLIANMDKTQFKDGTFEIVHGS